MESKELDKRFSYHPLGESAQIYCDSIRKSCRALADVIDMACPEGREKSLAMTKLEEVMFWTNAAIARESTT